MKVLKNNQIHAHVTDDGREIIHSHQNTKAVLARLSRASGHLNVVKRMDEEEKDCSEVLNRMIKKLLQTLVKRLIALLSKETKL